LGVVSAVSAVFILMFLGYGAKKFRVLNAEDAQVLSKVIMYFTLPCFVFEAVYNYHEHIPLSIAKIPFVGFGGILIVLLLAYAFKPVLKLDGPTLGGVILACGFGNTGFLGYPVVQAAFGHSGLMPAAMYDEFGMAFPLYTVGMAIAAYFAGGTLNGRQMLKMATTPAILGIPIALILRGIPLPHPVLQAISYLGVATVPLAMLTLGLTMSAGSLKGMGIPLILVCIMKLAVLPFVTYYGLGLAGIVGQTRAVVTLESGMPSAVMACVIASMFGANERFVAGAVFVTTLLGVLTLPLTILILHR